MYKLIIDHEQYKFLLKNIKDEFVLNKMLGPNQPNGSYVLLLEKYDIENLLNNLSDLFSEIGLLPSDEPNETGYFIEAIIDKLSILYYEN